MYSLGRRNVKTAMLVLDVGLAFARVDGVWTTAGRASVYEHSTHSRAIRRRAFTFAAGRR